MCHFIIVQILNNKNFRWIISGPLQIDITKEPLVNNDSDH